MSHSIGNPQMDGDLTLVESFVKSYHEKENIIIQTSVQSYYVSAIYAYWDKYKKYILGVDLSPLILIFNNKSITHSEIQEAAEIIDDLIGIKTIYGTTTAGGILAELKGKIYNLKKITYRPLGFSDQRDIDDITSTVEKIRGYVNLLQSNINKDEDDLIKRVNSLQNKFNEKYYVDMIEINRILVSISNKICIASSGNIPPYRQFDIVNRELKSDIYPLINNTGLFSYNTYLYGLFDGIFLVGVPERYSLFDSALGCSERFHKHDMDHIRDIRSISPENFNTLKLIYNTIIFDTDISKSLKEEYIHTLFYWIHESALLFVKDNEPFGDISLLFTDTESFYDNVSTPFIVLDPLMIDIFILHNGADLNPLDELFLQNIKDLQYGFEPVREILLEEFLSTKDALYNDKWLDDKTSQILYYMKICNLRFMRYIQDKLY